MKRLLITGANRGLGAMCRNRLGHLAEIIRVSGRRDLAPAAENEELFFCDLSDKDAVHEMVEGCDGIVHMGGQSVEAPWETIRSSNIDGMVNLYEAARKHNRPRILFASSNHAIGFYEQTERIDADAPTRPDGLYGVSKVFGEALARMYYDKFGIETACVRIGSCFEEPANHRMLSTWMSYDDFILLIERIFMAPRLGCPIIYGASANTASWWDNHKTAYLGWQPKDSSERFREKLDNQMSPPPADAPQSKYQGGDFTADGIHQSEDD